VTSPPARRIARELHDAIAHNMSMMVVQAGAERRVLTEDQSSTRDVLQTVEQIGRGALTEMSRLVGMLRRGGKVTTLVATDVEARDLDVDAISHVINYDPPEDGKGYLHRVGRTGRASRSGQGITLVLPEQQAEVSRFATMLGHREEFEATGMKTARAKLMYTSRRGRRSKW
jgi:ERCC4-related helicase